MPYYYEQKNFHGEWCPRSSYDVPIIKSSEGQEKPIRNIHTITEDDFFTKSLSELFEIYRVKQEEPSQVISFKYRNHRGITAIRSVKPKSIVFRTDKWHGEEPQWIMEAHCLDKDATRGFLLSACDFTTTSLVMPAVRPE